MKAALRLALSLLCTAMSLANGATAPLPVVAFQFPDRWLGLTPGGQLLDARITTDALSLSQVFTRPVLPAEATVIAGKLRHLIDQLPPGQAATTDETLVSDEPSFVRCTIWLGSETVEYDVQSLRLAAPPLLELFETLEKLLKDQPETKPPALVMAQSLDRRFGPEQISYAEGHLRSGQSFTTLDATELAGTPASLRLAFSYPGSLGIQDSDMPAWLQENDQSSPVKGFFDADGRHFQIVVWQGGGTPLPRTGPAHPKSGKISQPTPTKKPN